MLIMVTTEIIEKNSRKYYYRAKSIRNGNKVRKERIYLGADLNKEELALKEKGADLELNIFTSILTKRNLFF